MKEVTIVGDGVFGTFLKTLLPAAFEVVPDALTVILAVPVSALHSVGQKYSNKHIVNVCSVQKPSTDILRKYTPVVTSIHPLFGPRTPADKRHSILTHKCGFDSEAEFLCGFEKISSVRQVWNDVPITPEIHDQLMARTHLAAVIAAKQLKPFVERAQDVPDELIPNSFRLMRQFVQTMEDMPPGTMASIWANPYM